MATASAAPLVFQGTEGLGKGKHIVFLAGDHEYRSEESLPALARILALSDERVTASRLLDLLALAPVRAKCGLGEAAVDDVREMVVAAGIRWAWNAADRARHGQPELDQNTVRFGLERLALGVLLPDEEGTFTLPGERGFASAVPLDVEGRERVARPSGDDELAIPTYAFA